MKPLKLETADSLRHITKPPMLIEDIIPQGSITIAAGPKYSGKTFFALEAARCIAGFGTRPFMDRWPRAHHGNVLFIECDAPQYDTGRALWAMLKEHAGTLGPEGDGSHLMEALQIAWHPPIDLAKADSTKRIVTTANSLRTSLGWRGNEEITLDGAALIIFDTFRRIHRAEENSSTEMQAVMSHLDYIRNETGAAILLLHHVSLGEIMRARGSTDIEGSVDNIFLIKKRRGKYTVKVDKARGIQTPDWTYDIITTEDENLGTIKRVTAEPEPITIEKPSKKWEPLKLTPTDLLQWLPATTDELVERSCKSKSTLYRWLTLLEAKQLVCRNPDGSITLTTSPTGGTIQP